MSRLPVRKCSSFRKLCFGASAIVAVVCSIVLSKGIKPFMRDTVRGTVLLVSNNYRSALMFWSIFYETQHKNRKKDLRSTSSGRLLVFIDCLGRIIESD